jgi:hypothetical protein
MNISAHPHLDLLELHILERLSNFQNEWVEEHLLVCVRCNGVRNALEEQIRLIQAALA